MRLTALTTALLVCSAANAAEITRVASSFEKDDPFGLFLDFTFDRTQDRGKIVREWYQDGTNQDVTELRYSKYETALGIDAHIGIFRDVELHVGVPIIFQQDRYWGFAALTDAGNTTLYRNCGDAAGNGCNSPGAGTDQLFAVGNPSSSFRSGLGDLTASLAWAPFVQKKDPSKPTWVMRFLYTAPTANLLNPSVATSASARGGIGEKLHKFGFSTSLSKRLGAAEPYFELHYTLPIRASGFYSNCADASAARQGHPENCGKNGWAPDETGIHPAHTGGIAFGIELTPYENAEHFQRFTIDFRTFANYTSESRSYNEMSDLLGKLLTTSDYGTIGGQVGFVGQAADFLMLRGSGSIAYNTEHFLTGEVIGKDLNGNGVVDVSTAPEEINPNYDFRVDRPGRRFRIQEQLIFRLMITAVFNF